MSANFKADHSAVQALAEFLASVSEVSRETGVWFCAYSTTEVSIPGGSIVQLNAVGDGDEREYVIDDQIGA